MKCKVCGKGRPLLFVTGRFSGAYCNTDCYDKAVAIITDKLSQELIKKAAE